VFKLIVLKGGGIRFEGGGCTWCRAAMVSFEGIVGVMGWRALASQLYSLAFPKIRHRQKQMIKAISHER
jgi:hypothetical protein